MTRDGVDPAFERLLDFVKLHRSFDFTGYRRSSLMRRVALRMRAVEVASFDAYVHFLAVHPDEFQRLFDVLLVNVTQFFRDAEAWRALAAAIGGLVERTGPGEPIRVWSAGCATGQEPYSLLMLLAEALGIRGLRGRVTVYATDVDGAALAHARRAVYPLAELATVPEALRERYFVRTGTSYSLRADLRRHVVFGHHDLTRDPGIPHLDVLTCRNVLMYLNREAQARILARLHFTLKPHGLLLLGRAEMIDPRPGLFTPVDLRARLFARAEAGSVHERLLLAGLLDPS